MMTNDSSSETNVKKEVGEVLIRRKKLFSSFFSKLDGFFPRKKKISTPKIKLISARALIGSTEKYCVIDLRSLDDFFKDHIILDRKGISFNVPYDSLDKRMGELRRFLTKKLLIYSDDSDSVKDAALKLISAGFDVTVLVGGYTAYKNEMYR